MFHITLYTLKVQRTPITNNLHNLTRKLQNKCFLVEIWNSLVMTVIILLFLNFSYSLDYLKQLVSVPTMR